jgi:hypothetical protein
MDKRNRDYQRLIMTLDATQTWPRLVSRFVLPAQGGVVLFASVQYGPCRGDHPRGRPRLGVGADEQRRTASVTYSLSLMRTEDSLCRSTRLPVPETGHTLHKPMWPSHQLGTVRPCAPARCAQAHSHSRNPEPAVPFRSNPERARAHMPLATARCRAFTPTRAAYTNEPTLAG